MKPRFKPQPTPGICGGGQLAKMTAHAAAQFGCEVVILERQAGLPAASLATRTVIGDWYEPDLLTPRLRSTSRADPVATRKSNFLAEEKDALSHAGDSGADRHWLRPGA